VAIIEYQLTFTVVPDIADVLIKDIPEEVEKFGMSCHKQRQV
jgi:hypothetical protein